MDIKKLERRWAILTFIREKRDERRLIAILRESGLDHYWQASFALVPFEMESAKHYVSIYRIKRELHLWGISRLVFKTGRVPTGVTRGVIRRNSELHGLRWVSSQSWDYETFAVTVAKQIEQLDATELRNLLGRTVQELERCRQILDFVRP